jgi:hypothetical protein
VASAPQPPLDRSEPDWPTSAPSMSADQPVIASAPPARESNGPDQPASAAPASAEPLEVASDAPARDRDDPDWPTPIAAPEADVIELPAPDENAFATDYRPWRTVILADGSEAATYLALNAVTQWTDPPTTPVTSHQSELPAPAIPDYFGGGETVTSIAE